MSKRFIYYGSFASVQFLSDLFGMPAAAYSLRKLTLTATNCIRVRRSSDNTEQDIGFVANVPNSPIDTTALLAFVGAGNGFVTTWYDQSTSSSNLTQTSGGNQPRIVSSGVVDLEGSAPTLAFNRTSMFMNASGVTTGVPKTLFIANKFTTDANERVLFDSIVTTQSLFFKDAANRIDVRFGSGSATSTVINTNFVLYSLIHNSGANSNLWRNSSTHIINNGNIGSNAFNGFRLGAVRGTANLFWSGTISEVLIYASDKSTDRTSIDSNIITYYGI
jgi:hypothetical protein